jgi:alpha-amylase
LRGGDAAVTTYLLNTDAGNSVMAYLRRNGRDEVLVVINFSKVKVSCVIDDEELRGEFKNIFTKGVPGFTVGNCFDLEPWGYLVFEK